ncbi:MAG: ribbon-helix-helix domain-containing protein [Pseudomonadota bacterium]
MAQGPAGAVFFGLEPAQYRSETRRLRLNGQSTSIRLERAFWTILDRMAEERGMSTPGFLSALHAAVLETRGEPANFASLLRCISLAYHSRGPLGVAAE